MKHHLLGLMKGRCLFNMNNKKVLIGLELTGGLTVIEDITDIYKGETEKELLESVHELLELKKGNFIIHGSRVVNVDQVISAFVEIREN
jgi:hypothetical protein